MEKEGESRDGQACAIPSPIEMCAHVEVTSAAGETVAAFEPLGFRAWKAKMQTELGVKQWSYRAGRVHNRYRAGSKQAPARILQRCAPDESPHTAECPTGAERL